MAGITQEESKLISRQIFEKLASRDPVLIKQAESVVDKFTKTRIREDGYYRKIMPPIPVTNSDLDRDVESALPMIIVDKEPNSPAAISIPFATLPMNLYIEGDRYRVYFDRIVTTRFTKDVDELRTWIMDIRAVLSDNAIKDMLAEEDGKFTKAVNTAVVGPNLIVPTSGTVQYQRISSGISRDSLWDSLKVLPNTPSNLEVKTIVVNNITIKDFGKFGHDESGGTMSEDIMKNGWTLAKYMGKDLIVTIKKGLVPTNTMYHFADPEFIGKSYELEATTMYIKREAFMLEFFAYETLGGAIGNTSGVARIDFV